MRDTLSFLCIGALCFIRSTGKPAMKLAGTIGKIIEKNWPVILIVAIVVYFVYPKFIDAKNRRLSQTNS